jgi:2'-5' RNA ligase
MTRQSSTALRLFVAMPLTQDALARAQATIAALRTADTGGDIRWVRPEGLHITLAHVSQLNRRTGALVAA